MNHYSNPTANAAIGAVDREINQMRKYAQHLKRRRQKGLLTPAEAREARRRFVGIHRRFLREALEE